MEDQIREIAWSRNELAGRVISWRGQNQDINSRLDSCERLDGQGKNGRTLPKALSTVSQGRPDSKQKDDFELENIVGPGRGRPPLGGKLSGLSGEHR